MRDDDRALIARIAGGDRAALRLLYDVYQPRLYRYLWHQLDGDRTAIEDALQEIFLAIWSTAPGFRGEALGKTWIFRIAHYQAARIVRERAQLARRLSEMSVDEERDRPEWITSSIEDAVLNRLALEDAIRQLSTKHREVLVLLFLQGFSIEEIAGILEIPVGTVKSRISYARRALLRAMQTVASEEETTL